MSRVKYSWTCPLCLTGHTQVPPIVKGSYGARLIKCCACFALITVPTFKAQGKKRKGKRKAVKSGKVSNPKRVALILADSRGTTCHLCDRDIDMTLLRIESRLDGPSVDHIIPRSKGGTAHITNLALAHRSCNSRRGSRSVRRYRISIGLPA